MIQWTFVRFEDMDSITLYEIMALRIRVFIIEQTCLYEELDFKDFQATHLFARNAEGKIIAYLRILDKGVSYDEISIGRVVVHPDYRKFGYGRVIMEKGMEYIDKHLRETVIRISAQTYLLDFYKSLGFVGASKEYLEDDIPHMEMLFIRK